jgi:hypothetical protein
MHNEQGSFVGERVSGQRHIGLGSVVLEKDRRQIMSWSATEVLGT